MSKMMSSSLAPEKLLPSLPGYKQKDHKESFHRHKYLDAVQGGLFISSPDSKESKELPYLDATMSPSINTNSLFTESFLVSPSSEQRRKKGALTYYAHYDEATSQGVVTKECMIQYFLDDKSIKIIESQDVCNGISQKVILKRSLLLKEDASTYEMEDFYIGDYIYLYNRHFKLYSADDRTRKFLAEIEAGYSANSLTQTLTDQAPHAWDKFRVKKSDNSQFNEAELGNTVNNTKREGFVNYGDRTLKFSCLSENTQTGVGEKSPAASIAAEPFKLFTLVYHLCDDSIEIFSVPDAKISDPFTRLLKRSYLPKKPISVSSIVGLKDDDYYFWTDLAIGADIVVYARVLKLIDCDASTRAFFKQKGRPLATSIGAPEIPKIEYKREIPPSTQFGSDEDTLRSCMGSLRPSAPRAKIFDEDVKMAFHASLLSGGPDDGGRKFIINYFVTDKTLQVLEPPIKNSGFVGGVFLSRREIKTPSGGKLLPKDFAIGTSLQILKHTFLVENATEGTIRWMEEKKYPQSDVYTILKKIAPFIEYSVANGELQLEFETCSAEAGFISAESLKTILSKYCPMSYWSQGDQNGSGSESKSIEIVLNGHEILTIMRAFSASDGSFDSEKFISTVNLMKQ